jgi:hypothetical protein
LVDGAASTSWEKWTIQRSAGTTSLRVNGAAVALTNSGAAMAAPGALTQLGFDPSDGDYCDVGFAEVLAFNFALSPAQVATVEAYLLAKWGT